MELRSPCAAFFPPLHRLSLRSFIHKDQQMWRHLRAPLSCSSPNGIIFSTDSSGPVCILSWLCRCLHMHRCLKYYICKNSGISAVAQSSLLVSPDRRKSSENKSLDVSGCRGQPAPPHTFRKWQHPQGQRRRKWRESAETMMQTKGATALVCCDGRSVGGMLLHRRLPH